MGEMIRGEGPSSPTPTFPMPHGSHLCRRQEFVGWTFHCAPQKWALEGTEGAEPLKTG